jgi:hypothetical protein
LDAVGTAVTGFGVAVVAEAAVAVVVAPGFEPAVLLPVVAVVDCGGVGVAELEPPPQATQLARATAPNTRAVRCKRSDFIGPVPSFSSGASTVAAGKGHAKAPGVAFRTDEKINAARAKEVPESQLLSPQTPVIGRLTGVR